MAECIPSTIDIILRNKCLISCIFSEYIYNEIRDKNHVPVFCVYKHKTFVFYYLQQYCDDANQNRVWKRWDHFGFNRSFSSCSLCPPPPSKCRDWLGVFGHHSFKGTESKSKVWPIPQFLSATTRSMCVYAPVTICHQTVCVCPSYYLPPNCVCMPQLLSATKLCVYAHTPFNVCHHTVCVYAPVTVHHHMVCVCLSFYLTLLYECIQNIVIPASTQCVYVYIHSSSMPSLNLPPSVCVSQVCPIGISTTFYVCARLLDIPVTLSECAFTLLCLPLYACLCVQGADRVCAHTSVERTIASR